MKLEYIQRKSAVSSILWIIGCGRGMTSFPVRRVYAGYDLGNTIWLCRRGEGFLCGDRTTHLGRLITNFQKYILANPAKARSVQAIYDRRAAAFSRFITVMSRRDYKKATNRQLWSDYRRIIRGYEEVYPYGEPFAIALGELADRLRPEFQRAGLSVAEFEKIISPATLSFMQREHQEFLKIALSNPGKTLIASSAARLKRHHQKYTWLPYDYGVTAYSLKHFTAELEKLLAKDRRNLRKKYEQLKNYSRRLAAEQRTIIRRHNLGRRQLAVISILQTAYYLVDSKKALFTRCHWYSQRLFTEISRRLNWPTNLVQYLLPEEMEKILLQGARVSRAKVAARYDGCLLVIKANGDWKINSGERAKKIITEFLASRRSGADQPVLRGQAANKGRAQGRARVLFDAREGEAFRHGDILVTAMTSPDYMFAVRKSAAIITDEGGLTCHAAIVARELGIPCIVGTKIATQVLRDGDQVEVDATRGVVKICK